MGLDRYHTKRPLHDPLAALVCVSFLASNTENPEKSSTSLPLPAWMRVLLYFTITISLVTPCHFSALP